MTSVMLKDEQWKKIRDYLRQDPKAYVSNEGECRRFVEAVKWMSRSGPQWHLLPSEYGRWNSVYKRFMRWCRAGVRERMLEHFADEPDMENGMVDSTIMRAQQGQRKIGEQALGRSRGGFSYKVHVTVDG